MRINPIRTIDASRLVNIPTKHWPEHEFCFHMHDLMVRSLAEMDATRASSVSVPLSGNAEAEILSGSTDVFEFLINTGRTSEAQRVVINHCAMALYADLLHFLFEALTALEKRKFVVGFSLLRKPLKENLILLTWMVANEDEFFNAMRADPAGTFDQREISTLKKVGLIRDAGRQCKIETLIAPEHLHDLIYNRKEPLSLAPLFDKATHLVTRNKHIKTEELNLNFIFKNPTDDDIYAYIYRDLSLILLYLNILQIELYSRMGHYQPKYKQWLILTCMGAYSAFYLQGRSPMVHLVNKCFSEFMICPACQSPIRLKKADGPRFFITEHLRCYGCNREHHFPLSWLLSKIEFDIDLNSL